MAPRRITRRTTVHWALVGAVILALAGCSSTTSRAGALHSAPPPTSSLPPSTPGTARTGAGREGIPAFSHLFVVVMENEDRQGALSSPDIAALAKRYASADHWYAAAHPSLPNYLALASGSTWGITSDCTSCTGLSGRDLGAQLSAAGISWGAYMENIPSPCFLGPQSPDGLYAQKHDPFVYFDDVRRSPATCAHVQPLGRLLSRLAPGASAADVPRFVWVTPNLCHDGHNCSVDASGVWLRDFVRKVTASPAWSDGGAMVVTWDEGSTDTGIDTVTGAVTSGAGGGNVLTLVITPTVRAGLVVHTPYDHYSLLRTVEDAFGLPLLGAAASRSTTPLTAFFSTP